MDGTKYIGMDVHQASIVAVVLNASGKVVMELILETQAETVLQFIGGLSGTLWVTFEEGISTAWLHDLLKRAIKGTYVSVEPFHLFRYLDEQSFRYNERKAKDAERFGKVLASVAGKRLTWAQVTG